MSAPQSFADLHAALAAYAAGRCKRWVRVDGWQIDLAQAQAEAMRLREEPAAIRPAPLYDQALVAKNIAAELARAAAPPELPPLADPVLPAPPPDASAYRCPWCSRPWGGAP